MTIPLKRPRTSVAQWRQTEAIYRRKRRVKRDASPAQQKLWRGIRPEGSAVLLCGQHLMVDNVSNVRPAFDLVGCCVRCSQPSRISRHALDRWIERVAPGAMLEEARRELNTFIAGATVVDEPPRWAGQVDGAHEVLLSPAWPGVALVAKVAPTRRHILTVLTSKAVTQLSAA